MYNCQVKITREKGQGLYATSDFERGDIVYVCQVQFQNCQNTSYASQVGMDKWVLFTKFGRSINHSCEPNCGVGFNGTHWYYKAFRDIKKGEELLYDYAMANYKVENFPRCLCGSARCRNDIKGYRTLPIQMKKEYQGFYAPYIEQMFQQQMKGQ